MNDLTNSMLRSRAYVSLLQESRIRAPKIVFGKSLSSLLIRSRAYSMASSRWTPFSCLTAPHGGSLSGTYINILMTSIAELRALILCLSTDARQNLLIFKIFWILFYWFSCSRKILKK